jgi:iron complex outermembrane recepter protein
MLLPSQLAFQCGKVVSAVTGLSVSHSCDDDHLAADYYSLYATDQVDVTDKLKVRAGVRQDWWNTALTPLINVPGGTFNNEGVPLMAGVTQEESNTPVSWNVGALYKLFPGVSPYAGVSRSYLSNFNSENVQTGIGAPELALQYEAGIRFSLLNDMLVLNTAAFDVKRENVATPFTLADGTETVVYDSQRTTGYETSLDYKVTDQWRILANFTAQHAVIKTVLTRRPRWAIIPRASRSTWRTCGRPTNFPSQACPVSLSARASITGTRTTATPRM